jgi:hypothetical protein
MSKRNGRHGDARAPSAADPPQNGGNRKPPVSEFRCGRIRATIWENFSEGHEKWYSVVVSRSYKQGDTLKTAQSFGRDDLLVVAEVVRMAYYWVNKQLGGGQRDTEHGPADVGKDNGTPVHDSDIPY